MNPCLGVDRFSVQKNPCRELSRSATGKQSKAHTTSAVLDPSTLQQTSPVLPAWQAGRGACRSFLSLVFSES